MKKIYGFTDSKTTCECCGKENLKGTYAISIDGGEILHFGSTCAFKKFGITEKELKKESDKAKAEARYIEIWGGSNIVEAEINHINVSILATQNWIKIHEDDLKTATHPIRIESINETITHCKNEIIKKQERLNELTNSQKIQS